MNEQAKKVVLEQAMYDFAIRVLSGNGGVQEAAILPDILRIIIDNQAASGN